MIELPHLAKEVGVVSDLRRASPEAIARAQEKVREERLAASVG